MYSKLAEEEDNKMVDRWQKEAEGILIFAGLFSAVVASLLTVTIQDLKPNPQPEGNSEFYLKNICQSLSHQNDSCQPPFPAASDSTFSPPSSAIWVNSLWFLSVLISLTCAMLATFIQKWARRYIRITQPSRYGPHKRARLRAFFSDGVDKWHVSWAIEALPTLLHVSLFLFFIGTLIYLFTTNHVVFGNVVWWVVLSMVAYLTITFLPIFRPNSPYYAPLSSPIWYIYVTIRYTAFKALSSPAVRCVHVHTADRFRRLKESYYNQFLEDIGKTAEEIAWKQASDIDIRVLESTFDALGEVGAQEEFFAAIPGFFESELVNGLKDHITGEFRVKFREALNRFLERTLSLSSVSESVRSRRLVISLNAAHAALGFDDVLQILWDILNGRWPDLTQSVEVIQSLRHWAVKHDEFTPYIQRIVAQAVVDVQERGESWISLVKDEFGLPDPAIRKFIAHGNSVLLSILIHITRRTIRTGSWTPRVLLSLSGFSIHNTLPGLQHAFCTLWNDILLEARARGPDNIHVEVLREIRHVYIDLHRGTDASPTAFSGATYDFDPILDDPRSYRFCNIANHRQDLTIHTSISGSFTLPSPTQLDQSPDALPHHSPLRRHLTPRGSAATLESSVNHVTYHAQGFTWPSPTADCVRISTQPPSVSDSSVSESIGTAITWDPNLLVPSEASLSAAVIASAAKSLRPDDLTREIHINGTGETSQAPTAPLISQHPKSLPDTIAPVTGHDRPSCSVPDLGVTTDTLRDPTSSVTLSYSLGGNKQKDTAARSAGSDNSRIPSMVNFIPRNTFTDPPIIVSDSPSSPVVLPPPSRGTTVSEPPSSVESSPLQTDHILHAPRSPPSPPKTANSRISPQVAPALEAQVASYIGMPGPHDCAQNQNSPIPMTVLPRLDQTAQPAHDVAAASFQPVDQV